MARYFILIGNIEYDDKEINNLDFVENDINDLSKFLINHGEYDEVKIIKNKTHIETKIELSDFKKKIKFKDEIFIYISGHGHFDEDSKLYFIFKDAIKEYIGETSLNSSEITDFLNTCKASVKGFILDTCFSGGILNEFTKDIFDEKLKTVNNNFIKSTKGTFGIMSSRESEKSRGNSEGSLFTSLIIKGLKSGEACYSKGEHISFNELWMYIDKNFPKGKHVPQVFQKGEGNAIISRNLSYIKGQEFIKPVIPNFNQVVDEYKKSLIRDFEELKMIGFKAEFKLEDIYIPLSVKYDKDSEANSHVKRYSEMLKDKEIKAEELVNLENKVSIVLGLPGMGKTTMLHFVSINECKKDNGLIPVFIKLSEFSKSGSYLESYIISKLKVNFEDENIIKDMIKDNKLLILLDGLDEVSRDSYGGVVEKIRNFISNNDNLRIIITSRIAGFQYENFKHCIFEIDELPDKEIKAFIGKWFKAEKPELINCIMENERILELARNPFLLSIISVVYEKDNCLPRRRVELYKRCSETLLNLYELKRIENKSIYSQGLKEEILSEIAYEFFGDNTDEFPYSDVYRIVKGVMALSAKQVNEDDILKEICENSGILQKSDGNYLFIHRTFFEYYTAFRYRSKPDDLTDIIKYEDDKMWTEPICLYAAMLNKSKDATKFLDILQDKNMELAVKCFHNMESVVDDKIIRKLLKSNNIEDRISVVKDLKYKVKDLDILLDIIEELFESETNGEVIYWCVDLLENIDENEEVFKRAKVIVYKKLDKDADKRREKYLKDNLVHIKPGRFMMGGDKYRREKPIHEVRITEFYITKFLVTNELYEKFDPEHKNRRDKYSEEDNQPVIYVNWYEAFIFARWIGCKLPTEAQWEYVCRAGTKTEYNTGNELKKEQANFDSNIRKTTVVNKFKPNKWGLYDMHGNVDEWCRDWYDENYYTMCKEENIINNPENKEKRSKRVLRGGSWSYSSGICRSALRGSDSPGNRIGYVGFRICSII